MMNFRSVKKKKETNKKSIFVVGIAVLVLLGFFGTYASVSAWFSSLGRNLWKANVVSSVGLSTALQSKAHLREKITELEDEIGRLSTELASTDLIRQENTELKDADGLLGDKTRIIASILVKPNHTLYRTLIVDRGVRDGVKEGDIVLGYGRVAIGRVVDVRKNISFVEMFTASGTDSVLVHASTGIYVDTQGHGGSMLTFSLPRDASVAEGDFITLPYRDGFLFGTVEKISFNPTDPVQTVFARSAVNIHELQFVQIIDGYEEQF